MKELIYRIVRKLIRRILPANGATKPTAASPLLAMVEQGSLLPSDALLRLGTPYGGWLIPAHAKLGPDSVCYLAGAGEDISFDCALVRHFGCHTRIIDPTPRAIEHFQQLTTAIQNKQRFPINNSTTEFYDLTPAQLELIKFLPVGLADKDIELKFFLPKNPAHVSCSTVNLQKTSNFFTAQCHRLSTLMAQQHHPQIDLLKMDIEGAEYAVIRDLVSTQCLPHLLLIEFDEAHSPQDDGAAERIHTHVQMLLNAGMRCAAIEGSNMTFISEAKD